MLTWGIQGLVEGAEASDERFESRNLLRFSFKIDSVTFAFVGCLLRVLVEAIAMKYLYIKHLWNTVKVLK